MNKFLFGLLSAALLGIAIYFFVIKKEEREEIRFNSSLIQQQIQQVGKLVVTEGNFSQVTSYKNTRKNFLDVFSAQKKALVIVNAKVTISYDLRQITTSIDETSKTITITSLPKEEVNIYPDIEYYDVTQDYFNKFEADDYNKIKAAVYKMIEEKIDASDLRENAKSRLVSELQKIYILTSAMGWTLKLNDNHIYSMEGLERFQF